MEFFWVKVLIYCEVIKVVLCVLKEVLIYCVFVILMGLKEMWCFRVEFELLFGFF